MPQLERIEASRLKEKADYDTYIRNVGEAMGYQRRNYTIRAGEALKELQVFYDLLEETDKGLCDVSTLINRIAEKISSLKTWLNGMISLICLRDT